MVFIRCINCTNYNSLIKGDLNDRIYDSFTSFYYHYCWFYWNSNDDNPPQITETLLIECLQLANKVVLMSMAKTLK